MIFRSNPATSPARRKESQVGMAFFAGNQYSSQQMKECNRLSYLKGLKDAMPIMLGYFAVSFTLGINASQNGFSWFQAGLMSFLNHTSAGQAAAIRMIADNDSYLNVAISQIVINLRYLLM